MKVHNTGKSVVIFRQDALIHNNSQRKNIKIQIHRKNAYRIALRHEWICEALAA